MRRYPEIHRFVLQVIIALLESSLTTRWRSLCLVGSYRIDIGNNNLDYQAKTETPTNLQDSHLVHCHFQAPFEGQREDCIAFPRAARDRRGTYSRDPNRPDSRALPHGRAFRSLGP